MPDEKVEEALARCPEGIRSHAEAVAGYADKLAEKLGADRQLVRRGALLHDLGRSRTQGSRHAAAGAEMVEELGLGDELAELVRRHVGAGITREESQELGLPEGDYSPITLEEKVVSYADSRFSGERLLTFDEALERFRERLGEHHPSVERFRKLHRDIVED